MGCASNKKLCINPSDLRNRVSIEGVTAVPDGAGGQTETWANVMFAWAKIEPASGQQKWQAMQSETIVTHKITMRYQAGITTSNRINFSGRIFDIVEVLNIDERNIVLQILAKEGLYD